MTTDQIFALSMPLITAAMVWVVGMFIRRPWTENRADHVLQPSPIKREGVLDRLELLNAEIEGKAHLARQQLRQLKKSSPT